MCIRDRDNANNLKIKLQKEKMSLSWVKYKKIIEEFLRKAFDNCKLIEDFEDKTKLNNIYDFMTEDHFYVCLLYTSTILFAVKYYPTDITDGKRLKQFLEQNGQSANSYLKSLIKKDLDEKNFYIDND